MVDLFEFAMIVVMMMLVFFHLTDYAWAKKHSLVVYRIFTETPLDRIEKRAYLARHRMENFAPYLIRPKDATEAVHGKATLLTDTAIGLLLEGLDKVGTTVKTEESICDLYKKLVDLWGEPAPYCDPHDRVRSKDEF